MKPEIILIGGGGHCNSCIDVIEQENKFQIAGVVDAQNYGKHVLGYSVLGGDKDLADLRKTYEYALVTIGQIKTPEIRIKLYQQLILMGFSLPTIISPRAYVSKHAVILDGSIVMHNAVINAQASIGSNCIINTQALIEHDSKIGSHCHISTGAIVNGGVTVGNGVFIGSNAVVRHSVQINDNFSIPAASFFSGDVNG
jgi:acetyltransferase-like isoleucine patch superfamily enzyme